MAAVSPDTEQRRLTIGAVCRSLKDEFPDVSISKIRYLEDQGLLALRRTQGGYRLFADEDVERLKTILRLQRDEFLPLRVIRDELSSPGRAQRERKRAAATGIRSRLETQLISFEDVCERSGGQPAFVRELEDYGIIESEGEGRGRGYPEADADIVGLCSRLAQYGIEPRNLRAIRTGIEREASLLEALVAPALRSRNPERRQSSLEELDTLAGLTLELSQLLFWRSLRSLVTR